jgi:hypothetical protein
MICLAFPTFCLDFKSFSLFNGSFLEFCKKMNYSQDEKQFVFFELAQIYGPVVHFYDGAIGEFGASSHPSSTFRSKPQCAATHPPTNLIALFI